GERQMPAAVLLELEIGFSQIVGATADIGAGRPPPVARPLDRRRPLEPTRRIAGKRISHALARRSHSRRFEPHRRARHRAARIDDQIRLEYSLGPAGVRGQTHTHASRTSAVAHHLESGHRGALAQLDLWQLAEQLAHARLDELAARAQELEPAAVARLPSLSP